MHKPTYVLSAKAPKRIFSDSEIGRCFLDLENPDKEFHKFVRTRLHLGS